MCKRDDVLKKIFANVLKINPNDIEDNYNLIDAAVSSISFIKIIILAEDEFDVEFEIEELDIYTLKTFKDFKEFVYKKIDKNANSFNYS